MARRRKISTETEEALRRRQANLTALSRHPAWPDLQEEIERKTWRMERTVLGQALGGGANNLVDPAQVQWIKGFIAGMHYFAAVPENAESRLRRYLKEQGVNLEGVEA